MPLKQILTAILVLAVFAMPILAQEEQSAQPALPEGYVKEEAGDSAAIYNPEQIRLIFYTAQTANEAYQHLHNTSKEDNETDGVLKLYNNNFEIAELYGTIVADVENKKLTITNGGFRTPYDESGNSVNLEANMTGEKIEVYATRLPVLLVTSVSGVYTQYGESFACAEKCRLTALVHPVRAYLNMTGPGIMIKSEFLEDYKNGRDVPLSSYARISGLYEMDVPSSYLLSGALLLLSMKSRGGTYEGMEMSSGKQILIKRKPLMEDYYDEVRPMGQMEIVIPEKSRAGISPDEEPVEITIKGVAGNLKATLAKGDIYILGDQDRYATCARKQITQPEEREFFMPYACLFADTRTGTIGIKPRVAAEKQLMLEIEYPASNVFRQLNIEQFEDNDINSRVTIRKQGSGTKLVFSWDNILPEGGNWFDLGAGFSAWVFNSEINNYNHLECNIRTKECFLDNDIVSGLAERPSACENDNDCGEGRFCGCIAVSEESRINEDCFARRCIRRSTCNLLKEANSGATARKPINIAFIADGYRSKSEFEADATKAALGSGGYYGLLSVSPFSDAGYSGKFRFHAMYGNEVPGSLFMGVLAPDYAYINKLAAYRLHGQP